MLLRRHVYLAGKLKLALRRHHALLYLEDLSVSQVGKQEKEWLNISAFHFLAPVVPLGEKEILLWFF